MWLDRVGLPLVLKIDFLKGKYKNTLFWSFNLLLALVS